jgi:hypothetical protein
MAAPKSDYEGKTIKLGKMPRRMEQHNADTYGLLVALLLPGPQPFEAVVTMAEGHQSGDAGAPHAYQFVTYCLKPQNRWLEVA